MNIILASEGVKTLLRILAAELTKKIPFFASRAWYGNLTIDWPMLISTLDLIGYSITIQLLVTLKGENFASFNDINE